MLTLGLVGGIASGKSFVAECFRDLGAAVLDADRAGHAVLREPEVIGALRNRWGDSILDSRGQISRKAVAKLVFAQGNEAELRFLEELTHPRIEKVLHDELNRIKTSPDPPPAIVLDAALLFEAGWDKLCDKVIFIDAPRDVRLERAVSRGWSAEQFAAREAAQMPVQAKRERCDIVIRNVRTLENTRDVVRLTWRSLLAAPGPKAED
jgi:dephospho-CoA kinase